MNNIPPSASSGTSRPSSPERQSDTDTVSVSHAHVTDAVVSSEGLTDIPGFPHAFLRMNSSIQHADVSAPEGEKRKHAETSPLESNKRRHLETWDTWAQAGADNERRQEAVARIKAWLTHNQPDIPLDLSSLNLTSLPEQLPDSIKYLNVSNNDLTSLPDSLPTSLEELDVSNNYLENLPESLPASLRGLNAADNELISLPDKMPALLETLTAAGNKLTSLPNNLPASLRKLDVAYNRLTRLADHLPPSLQEMEIEDNYLAALPNNLPTLLVSINASNNRLTGLPDNLPVNLEIINAENNRLTSLPEDITTSSHRNTEILLQNNPLPGHVLARLAQELNAPDYDGPTIHFESASFGVEAPVRPLNNAVADWYDNNIDEIKTTWHAFATESGADAFSRFLDRLGGAISAGSPAFRQSVSQWLSYVAEHPKLREQTMQISLDATAECDDRVSLKYNDMKKAQIASEVEDGLYDDRLPDLIILAKGMFRLDKLEEIAREKVESLREVESTSDVDEIEVYLAYQSRLMEKLKLPLATPDMHFFNRSYLKEVDLDAAESRVKALEQEEFIHYLSTDWKPWQSTLQRKYEKEYGEAQDKLHTAIEKDFHERLSARLKKDGLENDPDAERTVGPLVFTEIKQEINAELTRKFLEHEKLTDLLIDI